MAAREVQDALARERAKCERMEKELLACRKEREELWGFVSEAWELLTDRESTEDTFHWLERVRRKFGQ